MDVAREIRSLGERFAARIDAEMLSDALQYLEFDEWALALEVLADKLGEAGSLLTERECDMFEDLAERLGLPKERFDFLRQQVT